MHAASLRSPRLQRLLKVLKDGHPHSTREIARKSHILAISACVAELRQHGADIICERKKVDDRFVFFYTMLEGPKE
ncbi:hypothetical protein [Yoonia sp.]|uniref:hypothetical protein n=1 Tax=Yoonia sp. TaxID=2212373 RepID=UPI00358E1C92